MIGRGDIVVRRVHSIKEELRYAEASRLGIDKIIQQVIKQEKDWCKNSIFLAIDLNNLIEYDVDVDYSVLELRVTARLRECIPYEKMKEIQERELSTNIKSEDNAKSD